MGRNILIVVISIFAFTTVVLELHRSTFKDWTMPIPTLGILVIAYLYGNRDNIRYFRFIIVALVLCAVGDIIPLIGNYFTCELILFMFAKYFFCEAFLSFKSQGIDKKLFLGLLLIGLLTFALLAQNMGEYILPAALFVGMTIYFVWSGIKLYTSSKLDRSKYVLFGILTWFICDILIGIDRFFLETNIIGMTVILSYWIAIYFIVLSLLPQNEKSYALNELENEQFIC